MARWSCTLGLLVFWLILALSLMSYDPADAPGHAVVPPNNPYENWIGPAGAYMSYWTFTILGGGAWIALLGIGFWITRAALRRPVSQPALRVIGVVLLSLAVSGFQSLLLPNFGNAPEGAGGLLAIAGVAELTSRFSTLGSALWLLLLAGVGAIVAFDRQVAQLSELCVPWLIHMPRAIWMRLLPRLGRAAEHTRKTLSARREARRVRATDLDGDYRLKHVTRPGGAGMSGTGEGGAGVPACRSRSGTGVSPICVPAERGASDPNTPEDESPRWAGRASSSSEEDEIGDDLPGAPQVFDADAVREKIAGLPVRFAGAKHGESTEDHLHDLQNAAALENYRFPGLDLLENPEESYSEELEQYVREQAEALESALRVYRIEGEVVGIDSGPVITLYEVRLAPGTKVSRLTAVSSDIARALKAINIRIVANMAGRDTVGVEVPNLKKEKVRLKELMTSAQDADRVSKMMLPMFLGKDASGEPLIEDLAQMPHTLIAGTTGSGKSVCLNTIIMGFLFTRKPNELKLVLIDPKMVELSAFRDIPHLMCPVVTEMSKAAAILEWAVTKMDERYELLAEAGVRDIASYNDLDEADLLDRMRPASEREAASIPRKLPYIVFIIDELADLMMTHKEVEGAIVRIAQKARAVGIHLVLATQRPQANVVTGLIKSNMPARMTFKVASGMDSRIVLDQKGGELLLGQGDMLFLSPRSHKLMRAQGTLVDDRETRRVVRFLRDVAAPSFERQLIQIRSPGEDQHEEHESRGLQSALEDPLFEKAVDIIIETKRGSVSLLQRRLAIGYTRASRLIDLMGEVGVIGAYKGTVAREVVVSPEQWEDMRAQLRALAAGQPDLFMQSPIQSPETDLRVAQAPPHANDDGAVGRTEVAQFSELCVPGVSPVSIRSDSESDEDKDELDENQRDEDEGGPVLRTGDDDDSESDDDEEDDDDEEYEQNDVEDEYEDIDEDDECDDEDEESDESDEGLEDDEGEDEDDDEDEESDGDTEDESDEPDDPAPRDRTPPPPDIRTFTDRARSNR